VKEEFGINKAYGLNHVHSFY